MKWINIKAPWEKSETWNAGSWLTGAIQTVFKAWQCIEDSLFLSCERSVWQIEMLGKKNPLWTSGNAAAVWADVLEMGKASHFFFRTWNGSIYFTDRQRRQRNKPQTFLIWRMVGRAVCIKPCLPPIITQNCSVYESFLRSLWAWNRDPSISLCPALAP